MKLRKITIKNFRSLLDVTVPIGDTTVLIGENNSGKTALLDALRITLSRGVGARGQQFDEYDYHMVKLGDSPQTCNGITIELWFMEDASDEWPKPLIQALQEIIQTDPARDINSIGLRLSSKSDTVADEMVTKVEFLALNGQPLAGKGASTSNFPRFLTYIRLFPLSALRDSNDEFSPRSQYWGRILRDLKISDKQIKSLTEELVKLNDALLKADPRLEQVRQSLDKVQKFLSIGSSQNTSIQALPLKPWDLMSKSQVVIKPRGSEVDLPLSRHGQGIQSLAVVFLFQAYVDVLLKATFEKETEAIFTLEEPEAHLHPQATRALALNLGEIKSQKIISSHSPYFIQDVPLQNIRLVRRVGPISKVLYLKRSLDLQIPNSPDLLAFCAANSAKFSYQQNTSILTLNGRMAETEYRRLITAYPQEPQIHQALRQLFRESQLFLDEVELARLDTYAKRIRGEIFFARAWLLCEGQSEYLLLRYFAELMQLSLDHLGITVIDYQNNGSPGAFVSLARAFEIPWLMLCDNDSGRKSFVAELENRGLTPHQIKDGVRSFPEAKTDLELYLVKHGFAKEYARILTARKITVAKTEGEVGFEEELAKQIRKDKEVFTLGIIEALRVAGADASRVPEFFRAAIKEAVALAS